MEEKTKEPPKEVENYKKQGGELPKSISAKYEVNFEDFSKIFKASTKFLSIKLQTITMLSRVVAFEISEKAEKLSHHEKIEEKNVNSLKIIKEQLDKLNEEVKQLLERKNFVNSELKSSTEEFLQKKKEIDEANRSVVSTAESYISSQQILVEVDETISQTTPRKDKLRADIRTAFTSQAPLRSESDSTTQLVHQVDETLAQLKAEKSMLESKLTQKKSQLRGNKLGLTTDETSAKSVTLRLLQAKDELTNLQNRLAETISLEHEQSGLAKRFQTEIEEIGEESAEVNRKITSQIELSEHLSDENRKLEEYYSSLESKEAIIAQEHEKLNAKLASKKKDNEEIKAIKSMRTLQLTTYSDSVCEAKSKLEKEIAHMNSNLKIVHERNAESQRNISAKRKLAKQLRTTANPFSSQSERTLSKPNTHKLFPSK